MEQDFYSRMNSKAAAGRAPSARPVITAALAAFLLGGATIGLLAWNSGFDPFGWSDGSTDGQSGRIPLAQASSADGVVVAQASTNAAAAVQAVEMVASQQGGIEARVVAMEQRLTALDLQAQAAYGNAARAEALLVAFAARRAIERGAPLDYLEEQIKIRFEDAYPNAVAAVLAAAEKPTTIDRLREGLDSISPRLLEDPQEESTWGWITRELSQLFVIRRQATPSPVPARRLDRAKVYLEIGQVENAIAEVRNMPGGNRAGQWLADAERYAAALHALDRLENSAIVGPQATRDIRDPRVVAVSASGAQ